MFSFFKRTSLPGAGEALPGRPDPIPTATHHHVNGVPLAGPYPDHMRKVVFGLGCFWGASGSSEMPGVCIVTAWAYAGWHDAQSRITRKSVAAETGHTEAVLVVYDPYAVSPSKRLLRTFWKAIILPRSCARAMMSRTPNRSPSMSSTYETVAGGHRKAGILSLAAAEQARVFPAIHRPR